LNVISNYAANVAHRNLERTDMEASQSLAKLSSGTRVVSAKDEAASLAIGSRLGAEVQGLRQATINAGQAISMLQIADGAMSQVNDIMIRMKTLSIKAASGQLSDTERGMLDTEYQALLAVTDRIAADTEFNGNQLINGSDTVITTLNAFTTADDNLLQAADGFHSIEFNPAVGDAAFWSSPPEVVHP
jgi:flagellin